MGSSSKDRPDEVDLSGSVATASDERRGPSRTKSERVKGERDPERSRERDPDREREHRHRTHKSKSSRTSKMADGDSHTSSHRRHRTREEKEERERKREERKKKTASMSDLVPELTRSSMLGSRTSLPYPSFSKAHSRECVSNSREDVSAPRQPGEPLTPEATDLGSKGSRRSKSPGHAATSNSGSSSRKASAKKEDRPPSPPETDVSADKRRSRTSTPRMRDGDGLAPDRPDSRTSGLSRSSSRRDDKSKLSTKSKTSSQATFVKSPTFKPPPGVQLAEDQDSTISDDRTAGARSAATSVLPKRTESKRSRRSDPVDDDSPESVQDSSPKTPTATAQFPPPQLFPNEKQPPNIHLVENDRPTPAQTPMSDFGPPPPAPPPPPPLDIQEVPRIDYLLQNGGLIHPVSKNFLSVLPRPNGTRPSNPPLTGTETMFAPFFNLLDQYQNVINKQGSVAVATGHKTVARRLLDRLEDVFSRDLPAEGCSCLMCEGTPEEHRGLGWGEVLERVGGRVELPQWPPFDLAALGATTAQKLADLPPRPSSPIKLDPDIAEEFRDHYLRQSKKVRSLVDKWMNTCAEAPAPPPSDVDDETLTFAILTSLEREERPYFNALISGSRELKPDVRAPTPNVRKPRADFLVKTGLSLQRLYRLPQAPRDAETAVYLIKNPFHHDLLVTIADISPQEWEILTSGRFDGFLWSGADGDEGMTPTAEYPGSRGATPASGFFSPPSSRPGTGMSGHRQTPGFGASRNTTPFSGVYSRGATPASFVSLSSSAAPGHNRQAVSHDEELEMAVLAEVEREIYQGMEALEDAFEKLHQRAEMVRNALRQRNAGLMMSMQQRRAGGRIDVLPQLSGGSNGYERPYWATGDDETSESDWGGDDAESLAPDDSASNISSSRHRRPKRRTERRTPAPIEEDDEEN
ncbi:hypothetical protein JX265_001629 [Neoarthrinium moseri]|uniref:5-methylcytosine g t mismatch-specific dna n=1 Tax=Neoarthrinium moseri TaxID=1658444 RepID=A0A9Q0AUS7_9PEZI|nr:uncharacterized protein JN550_004024 [Neoarthrinium moseri]KAI1851255.1 hypothetical protein JX266_003330 [Neoarthrinium moseri]KAI1872305.1 hypothetical protein JN550_004024 [Neoarthrinium moseri]KAI1880008.1 hypothetical protein JX265_001629 [Neoarthrinium moseri]